MGLTLTLTIKRMVPDETRESRGLQRGDSRTPVGVGTRGHVLRGDGGGGGRPARTGLTWQCDATLDANPPPADFSPGKPFWKCTEFTEWGTKASVL